MWPNSWTDQDGNWRGGGPWSGHVVLDGDPAAVPKKGSELPIFAIFGPFLLWPNGCMHQGAPWYGGRPQPRGLCVRCGPSPPKFLADVYYSYCDFVRTLHMCKALLVCSSSSSSLVFYAFYFVKFNRTQSVRYAQLHHSADS